MKLTLMLWTAAAAVAVTVQLVASASLETEEKELENALARRGVEVERRERRWEDQQQMMLLDAMGTAFQTLLRLAKRLSRKGHGRRRGKGHRFKEYGRYDDMPFKRNLEEKEERQVYDDVPDEWNLEGKEEGQLYDKRSRRGNGRRRGKGRRRGNGRRQGSGRRRGKGPVVKIYYVYDDMPGKRNLEEKEERQLYDLTPGKRLLEGKGDDAQRSVAEQDAVAQCRDFLDSLKIGEAAGKAERENKEQGEGKQEEIQEEGNQDEKQEKMDLKDLVQTEKMLERCLDLIP